MKTPPRTLHLFFALDADIATTGEVAFSGSLNCTVTNDATIDELARKYK